MEDENQNFDQLRKLLALKQHEQPPPGYFNKFSGNVVAQLRAERHADSNAMVKLSTEAPWLVKLWTMFETKPIFARAFGAMACAIILAGVYFSETPGTSANEVAARLQQNSPFMAGAPIADATALNQPLLMAATNQTGASGVNLFDQVQPLQVAPVSLNGGN